MVSSIVLQPFRVDAQPFGSLDELLLSSPREPAMFVPHFQDRLFTIHSRSTLPSSRGNPSPTTALVGSKPSATSRDIASSLLP